MSADQSTARPALQLPAGCTGDCDDGNRDCTCGLAVLQAPKPIGMWDSERSHPWRAAALYGAALLLGLLGSHLAALWGGGA